MSTRWSMVALLTLMVVPGCASESSSGSMRKTKPVAPDIRAPALKPERPTIPMPDAAAAWVPDGYRAEVVLAGLMYPTSVEFDDASTLYVAEGGYMPGDESRTARILKFVAPAEAAAGQVVVASGLSAPVTDLLWYHGQLYISHKGRISVVEDGQLRDLVTDLPSQGDHSNNQLAAGPDGWIYFGQGSVTNSGVVGPDNFAFGWPPKHPEVCDVPAHDIVLTGEVFESPDPRKPGATARTSAFQPFGRMVPAGTVVKGSVKASSSILRMQTDGSGLEVYAWGFRNPYGVQFGPDRELYVADAGMDERGSRHIANEPEKLWRVKQDGWYGWPDYAAGKPVTDAEFRPSKSAAPQFLMQEHPDVETPCMTFEPHASITQLDFSREAFGAAGSAFLAASGEQSPVTAAQPVRTGYWVKRVDVGTGQAELFFHTRPEALGPAGLEYVATAGPKRPVDLRFSPDGSALYVVDIGPIHYVKGEKGPEPMAFPGTGVVWRITRKN